jgi:outer membrane protein assembly factor BamB
VPTPTELAPLPPEATATETPTETPFVPVPSEPTETPTLEPPTPSPTPTSTQLPYLVSSLRAFVDGENRALRVGPGNIYTATESTLAGGTEVRLIGRNPSGEWVYACCLDDEPGWIRQVYAKPADNELGPGAPSNAQPDDVRWLNIQPVSSALRPLPAATAIPPGDFPLYRFDRGARGFVPEVPPPPVAFAWPTIAQAAGPLISPVVVVGSSVVVASADNHLYAFDRTNGNQRWRFNLGQRVTVAPLALDGRIYIADEAARIIALIDNGNEAVEDWRNSLPLPPVSSFNVHSDTLFIAVGRENDHQMLAVDRTNGNTLRSLATTGSGLRYPVVGDQLVYVADGQLIAWDVFGDERVWTRGDINNIPAPPVYARTGISSVAELYVADVANRLYSLDANTGETNWSLNTGEPISGLALNASIVFASGNGYVRAVSRVSGEELWRAAVAGQVLAGPLVDNELVLVTTAGGNVQFLNASTGNVLNSAVIPAQASGPAALSPPWIYVPGTNGGIYALRTSQ